MVREEGRLIREEDMLVRGRQVGVHKRGRQVGKS